VGKAAPASAVACAVLVGIRPAMLSTGSGRDKVTGSTTRAAGLRVLLGGAVMLLCAACHPDPSTPRGTAEGFLDAHYVHIDLPAALPLPSGLARHKLESERELG